eukprot:scaffold1105_cov93-Skeletonema_menzelii.AAC.4
MKRVEANDPVALCQEGVLQFSKGDYRRAVEYWTKAAELGDAGAHHHLSIMYHNRRVIGQYEGKKIHQQNRPQWKGIQELDSILDLDALTLIGTIGSELSGKKKLQLLFVHTRQLYSNAEYAKG